MRVLNVARGPLIVDEDLKAALDSGKVGGAALDVFRSEPITEHPLFGYPNVVVTPHLGASTAEATDRAGYQAAEQVVAALTGGARHDRGQRPGRSRAEDLEVLGPFLPLCRAARAARRWRWPRAARSTRIEVEFLGRIAERDTRPLALAVLLGVAAAATPRRRSTPSTRRRWPRSAASRSSRRSRSERARLHRPRPRDRRRRRRRASASSAPTLGRRNRPHLLEAWGQRFNIQLERPPRVVPLPRPARA